MTNFSSRSSSVGGKIKFPTHMNRRKAFLKLVQKQTNAAQRLLPDDQHLKALCTAPRHQNGRNRFQASSVDKFTSTTFEDSNFNKSCQQNRGNGDGDDGVENENDCHCQKEKVATNLDKEDGFDFERIITTKLIVDSIDDVTEYEKKYMEAVLSLTDSSGFHSRNNHTFTTMEDDETETTSNSASTTFQNGFTADTSAVHSTVTCGKTSSMFCPLGQLFTFVITFTAAVLLSSILKIEWPWSVFMKEPLLKGFVYSSHFELYETEDYYLD